MRFPSTCLAILLTFSVSFLRGTVKAGEAEILLQEVKEISTDGYAGGLCVYDRSAFAVAAGKTDGENLLPVVAASSVGAPGSGGGRVVAFGHEGFLSAVDRKDTGRLLLNCVDWVGKNSRGNRVGIFGIRDPLAVINYFGGKGILCNEVTATKNGIALTGIDVLLINGNQLTHEMVAALDKWIRGGGGCLIGMPGWGWVMQSGDNDRTRLQTDCPANKLLKSRGIVFSDSTPQPTTADGYLTGKLALPPLNAGIALAGFANHLTGRTPLPQNAIRRLEAVLMDAMRSIPPDDTIFRPGLFDLSGSLKPRLSTAPDVVFKDYDPLKRLLITADLESARLAKPSEIKTHPSSVTFPGAVPADAARIASRTVTLDPSVPHWHGTGLYAPAGEVIRIKIPQQFAGQGLAVRIGCHTDTLWHHDKWDRVPEIASRTLLEEAVTTVASQFGGLIYIDVPAGSPSTRMDITVSGAVQSPRFILGTSTTGDWKKHLADSPAPWGEIETKKVVLSMPRTWLQKIEDPEALLSFWDQVMDAEADLATIPRDRKSPERIVPDVQISAGYMHSGYPIMTHLDPGAEEASSLEKMRKGNWGYFHELGHNHQRPDWTFDGTGEVTCNLFSLYVTETLCGNPPGRGHGDMEPGKVRERIAKHLSQPDKFTRWKNDPFLALAMYDQLRAAFGWETYKKVFAEYLALPPDGHPKNDDEKRDQWLVRFSKATGRNLGPFFEKWGVPTSEAARQSISDLPAWMPDGW